MAVIRDRTKCIQKIEQALKKHKDKLAWVKIDSVEIKNSITEKYDKVEDIYFVAKCKGSGRPRIICAYRDSRNTYILHDDIAHINIGTYYWDGIPDSKCNKFAFRDFCNPVKEIHIWENPTAAEKILKGNLTDKNPDSPMRGGLKRTNINSGATFTIDAITSDVMKNNATLEQIAAHTMLIGDAPQDLKANINTIRRQLEEDHNLCYAYTTYKQNIDDNWYWRIIPKEDLECYRTQDYYKTFDYTDVDKEFTIPKSEKDVCCIGLGSAGSNILEQMARLSYFDKYEIIDFDRVETKNLRNQVYGKCHVGCTKTSSISNYMTTYTSHVEARDRLNVKTISGRYEYQDFSLSKYKYVISGFDTIKCRKGVLDKIKSKEIETQYLIDARYDGLTSSLFVVDVNNKEEMDYYEKLLLETEKELKDNSNYNWTEELVEEHMYDCMHGGRCSETASNIGLKSGNGHINICGMLDNRTYSCGNAACLDCIKRAMIQQHIPVPKDEGCLTQNIIHIYKLTSAWVTSAIKSIETENKKYFTHVDITVDPIPREMILRK